MLCAIAATLLTACDDASNDVAASSEPAATAQGGAPVNRGKPSAPIVLGYEVLGKPIVGLPVAINITVAAADDVGPVTVDYSINDTSALAFQEGQVERLELRDARDGGLQQVAVVPQREGRLYLNVSAEVQTAGGSMIKSMAIPIQVGSAPQQPRTNGELKTGPDGETVISMPAEQNQR